MTLRFRCGCVSARRWLLIAVGLLGMVLADVAAANDFFRPVKDISGALNAEGVYPHGQQFPIGLYSIHGNSRIEPGITNMQRAAAAGFTLAGPYYGANWRDFRPIYLAAQEGMKFTYQIRPPAAIRGVKIAQRSQEMARLSTAQIAANVREQVTAILDDPVANQTVARWSLGSEELRYWRASELRYLKVASDTIRAVEKERNIPHRPFWMYEPGHRNAAALKLTGVHQDIISKGAYFTAIPRGWNRAGAVMWNYTQLLSAAKDLKKLPHVALQLSQDFTDSKTGKNAAEIRRVIRHDAYLALVMGIKGINVFSMFENRPNLTTHNEQFEAYASVADELTGELDLQRAFLFGEPRSDLGVVVTKGPKSFNFRGRDGVTLPYATVHHYETAVGTDRYLFLVNSAEQKIGVQVTGLPQRFLLDDLFAGTSVEMAQSFLLRQLDVLGVAAYRIRPWAPLALHSSSAATLGSIVPEPSSLGLFMLACAVVFGRRDRRFQRSVAPPICKRENF